VFFALLYSADGQWRASVPADWQKKASAVFPLQAQSRREDLEQPLAGQDEPEPQRQI